MLLIICMQKRLNHHFSQIVPAALYHEPSFAESTDGKPSPEFPKIDESGNINFTNPETFALVYAIPVLWPPHLGLDGYTNKEHHRCGHCRISACVAGDHTQSQGQLHGRQSLHSECRKDCSDNRTLGSLIIKR